VGEASRPAPVARVDDDPVAQAAAARAVLWRYERNLLTADEVVLVLEGLGLHDYESGARTDALGRREVTARSVRRQRARRAATHPDVPGSPERRSTADLAGSTEPSSIEGEAS
jgi:hypothetical protein